jgi:carboxyl-terminal processing protease
MKVLRIQLPIWVVVPLIMVMMLLGMGGGYAAALVIAPPTNCPEDPEVCEQFGVFWQVWDLASENFVNPEAVDPDEMTNGAINGMLDSLGDQGHTRFLSAEEARQWDESMSGEFEGIGAYLDMRDGQAIVVSPIEGSPAEAAGLKSNDSILQVDGQDTEGWTIEELVSNIRGPKGTDVTLTVRRVGEPSPLDITITRGKIEVPSVSWRMLPDNVALIRLRSFSRRTTDELKEALSESRQQGATRIVLDLRNNLGGFVHEAVGVASQFLPEGSIIFKEQDRAGNVETTEAVSGGLAHDIPIVVLINYNTASSAEIVSGALQDQNRATLVGMQTLGTGTVLSIYNVGDGAKLLLGTVQWLTPDGRKIHRLGITPDVEVSLPPDKLPLTPAEAAELSGEELHQSDDVQLLRALEVLEEMGQSTD